MTRTVSPLPTTRGKRIVAFVAVLALVLQPIYSLVVAQTASAATVTPANMAGWTTTANDGASAAITYGDASVGHSALKISTADNNDSRVRVIKNVNVKLSDVGAISFDAKRLSGPEGSANASFRLFIDNNGDNVGDQWVVYETYYNFDASHTANLNSWQTWNVKDGKFWGSWNSAGGYDTNTTLANIPGITPDARIVGMSLGMGNYNPNWSSLVDNVIFNGETYDFELDPYVPTPVPSRPALSGTVIYDSMPATLPSNLPSNGFQATSTSAIGDKVSFAGSDRHLDKVAVTLSSWACQNGAWNGNCQTTPGATFSHPVTLNVYNVAADGSVGSLIGTKTQTFAIPYRPTADPSCPSVTQWRDTNGNCFNGMNHVVVFDASGITVPNTVIYSITYNTQSYGAVPTGADGPYNSLNVSLATGAATTGTNVATDEVFWNSTYNGRTAGLRADSGWSASGNPAVTFTATTPDTVRPQVTLTAPTSSTVDSANPSADVVIKATDNVALNKVVANFRDASGTLIKSTQSAANGATEFTHTVHLADIAQLLPVGNYTVRYNATDVAGNVSQTKDFAFTVVDKTKPLAMLSSPTTHGPVGSGSVAIKVDANDERGLNRITANIYKDGSLFKSTSSAMSGAKTGSHMATVALPDGTYTIRYNASDVSGNVASTGTFDITIDTTAPSVPELQFPANNATLNTNDFWFTWNPVDGATSYEWHGSTDPHVDSDGKLDQGFLWDGDNTGTQPVEPKAHSVGANGTWYWQVRSVDGAGNKSAWSAPWVLTIDLTAPVGNPNGTDTPGGTSGGNANQGTGSNGTDTTTDTSSTSGQSSPEQVTPNPTQLGIVAQLPFASIITGNGDTSAQNDTSSTSTSRSAVLGEQDKDKQKGTPLTDTGEVLGASDRTFLGIVWYGYLIIGAVLIGGWLVLAAFIRRRRGNEV